MNPSVQSAADDLEAELSVLLDACGMQTTSSEFDVFGFEQVIQNRTTGIKFQWSPREGNGWLVDVARLRDKGFPKHPSFIREDTVLDQYDLRSIAKVRLGHLSESLREKIAHDQPLSAQEVVEILLTCCDDVLGEDFGVFQPLNRSSSRGLVQANKCRSN
ncbi:MAG: hypothetical protein ACREWG_12135 [Gammaproteobacteria bacterium]